MECSRTLLETVETVIRSNNTNKWNAQEPRSRDILQSTRSNNTNKWNAQELSSFSDFSLA